MNHLIGIINTVPAPTIAPLWHWFRGGYWTCHHGEWKPSR